jgi:hypothetical protein
MTSRASAWFEQKYISGAIHVLQTEGYLTQGLASAATSQKGNTVNWKIAGRGDATEMSTTVEDRPTMNAGRTLVSATMKDWEANEWILTTDIEKMTEGEQQVAQQTAGMAMGRRFDKILFEAMDAEAGAITTIGDGSAAISLSDLLLAQSQIQGQGLPGGFVLNVAAPFRFLAHLMLQRGFASADYVQDHPLMKMIGARQYLGMKVMPMPDEYFAIPSANQADGYMWPTMAVGFATNTDERGKVAAATRIDYVPTKKAYFAANTMTAVGKVLLPEGIRRLRFSTNTALGAGSL